MKKVILFICLFSLSAGVTAQKFIPKAGISVANINFSDDIKNEQSPTYDDTKPKLGFVLGLGVEFSFSDLLSIQPEILFHQKGFKVDISEQGETYTETNTLNYIEVPVMARLNFGNFYANAGPIIGLGIGGSYEYKYEGSGFSFSESGKFKFGSEPANYEGDDIYVDNALEFGFGIGAGYKILGKIMIDLRYSIGLSSILDDQQGLDARTTNNSLQFTVGVPLGIK